MSPRVFVCIECGSTFAAFGGTEPPEDCPDCGYGELREQFREEQT